MLRQTLFFGVFVFCMASAQAGQDYSTVSGWFSSGQPLTFTDVKGAWSGRCINAWAQDIEGNNMLRSYESAGEFYLGTIANMDSSKKALPADYYDTYDMQADPAETLQALSQAVGVGHFTPVSQNGNSGTIRWQFRRDRSLQVTLKSFGGNIVGELYNLKDDNKVYLDSLGVGIKAPIGPIAYCYYSRRLE